MMAEATIVVVALAIALAARPWRLYGIGLGDRRHRATGSIGPLALLLAILPWTWVLPGPGPIAAQLHWSAAGLATLMLGWPVAVPVFILVALLVGTVDPASGWRDLIAMACWQGVVPATLALGVGMALRRMLGDHLFVYLLGRAFLGTVVSVFAAGALQQWLHGDASALPGSGALVARWLMAWGDGVITGMLASVFVAFAPGWLATWSDTRYLRAGTDR